MTKQIVVQATKTISRVEIIGWWPTSRTLTNWISYGKTPKFVERDRLIFSEAVKDVPKAAGRRKVRFFIRTTYIGSSHHPRYYRPVIEMCLEASGMALVPASKSVDLTVIVEKAETRGSIVEIEEDE